MFCIVDGGRRRRLAPQPAEASRGFVRVPSDPNLVVGLYHRMATARGDHAAVAFVVILLTGSVHARIAAQGRLPVREELDRR